MKGASPLPMRGVVKAVTGETVASVESDDKASLVEDDLPLLVRRPKAITAEMLASGDSDDKASLVEDMLPWLENGIPDEAPDIDEAEGDGLESSWDLVEERLGLVG